MYYDLFLKLPLTAQLVYGAMITLLVGLVLNKAISSGLKLHKTDKGFSFGFNSIPLSHAQCPNKGDALSIIERSSKYNEKIFDLKKLRLIRQQMMYGEAASTEVVNLLTNIYIEALRSCGVLDPLSSLSGKVYALIMSKVYSEMKRKFKVFVVNNHMIEKTEEGFKRYVDNNTKEFLLSIIHIIDTDYICTTDLSSTDLSAINREHIPELTVIIREAFYNAREVSRDINAIIKSINKAQLKLLKPFIVNYT